MWNDLYRLWRSVLVGGPSPRAALQEEFRRLLEERETLRRTASSYREFGYEEQAGRVRERQSAVDRRIGAIRLHVRRRTTVAGR